MNSRILDNRIGKLPPFKVVNVIATLSQTQGWGIKQLNVPSTWTITRGEGITVMVIDTGFPDHTDLVGGMVVEKCVSVHDTEDVKDDKNGHSTHCCGIIGARDNEFGMVGVAPLCNIITCKVLGGDGSGSFDAIIKGLKYAKIVKPDVISMSLGSAYESSEMHDIIKELYEMNIPIIAAAGNDGLKDSVNYPGKFPETICVAAIDENDNIANFSSRGKEVTISAPGVDIYSTYLRNTYAKLSGTSMATPFVAGVVALLIAKHRKQEAEGGPNDCKTVEQIRQHLVKYADPKSGIVGKDDAYGYGIIDPSKTIFETESIIVKPTISVPWYKKFWNWLAN
jgi:subtilisin family serine protease